MFRTENGNIINSETKIEFTIGKFLGLLGSIIGGMVSLFVGFYFMVFEPSVSKQIDSLKEHYEKIQQKDSDLLKAELAPFLEKIDQTEKKVSGIEGKVNSISNRFDDLNKIASQQNNSGGLSRNTPPPSN